MTVFSSLTRFVAVFGLLCTTASGRTMMIDLASNGKYWWGSSWEHHPKHQGTGDCICIKGTKAWKWGNSDVGVACVLGISGNTPAFNYREHNFRGDRPIEVTTDGYDSLWIDRVNINTPEGSRWYGSNNTNGWCMSKDWNDSFDKYATHSGCTQTKSFRPDGSVRHTSAYSRFDPVFQIERNQCNALRRGRGRRREELEAGVPADIEFEVVESEPSPYEDADPAGESPNHVHTPHDALVVDTLHEKIRELVRENSEVTDGQIDSVLNSAMLDVEHIEERLAHEGEEVEDFEDPDVYSYTEEEIANRNVQDRLRDLEEATKEPNLEKEEEATERPILH